MNENAVIAQEKNKYERINQKKNKANRRLKRRGDRGKSNKAKLRTAKFKSRTKQGERSYKGDITGRKVVTKVTKRKFNASYAQPNPYAGRKRKTEQSVAKKVLSSPKYTARDSETAKRARIKPRYSNKPRERSWSSSKFGRAVRSVSGKTTFTNRARYQGRSVRSASRPSERRISAGRVMPRSASGNYNVRKKRSPYSAFRPKKSWEKAFKGDITGRTFRTKVTTAKPIIQKPPRSRFSSKSRKGDRSYKGNIATGGAYLSGTKQPEQAWKRDISGKKLRVRTSKGPRFSGSEFAPYPINKKRKGDQAYKGKIKGGGYKSISNRKEVAGNKTKSSRPPGDGTRSAISFQGNIKSQKPLKGGGSVSRNRWNNDGKSVTKANLGDQSRRTAAFQGNLKASKPLKGGGSISRNRWNNNGQSVTKANLGEQSRKTAAFQGNLKSTKPLKGGGSVARNNWNNRGRSVTKANITDQTRKTASFQGNIKAGKPLKGGGSIGRNNWNNKGKSTTKPYESTEGRKAASYTGNMKIRERGRYDALASSYQGDVKVRANEKGKYDALAGVYKGDQKRKFRYKQNPNSSKDALKVRPAFKNDRAAASYTGNFKSNINYKRNPNSNEEALKGRSPGQNYSKGANFQGRTKVTWNYKQNPSSADESLRTIAPSKATSKGTSFKGRFKLAKSYRKNPNSADDALKGIGPSRAALQASNYQGNIKMNKRRINDSHPSYNYLRGNKSSTSEKDKIFSFKILFAKLFKKNESQPDNLKEKERAPRFDKRERDIWYE